MFESFLTYISQEKKYSPHTIIAYKRDLTAFASFYEEKFGSIDIAALNYTEIRSWIVSMVAAGLSNQTVNRKVSALNTYFKFLVKIGQRETNPLAAHKALKTTQKVNIPFSEKEMQAVFELLDAEDFSGVRDKLMIELFYTTGIRRQELIQLKEASVDNSRGLLKVVGKRNKERYVPLVESVKDSLKLYMNLKRELFLDTEFLFVSNKGNKMYGTLVYGIINNYFSKISTKVKRSPHVIRHSFATHLLNNGADLNSIKELLGHSSLASTQIYTKTSLDYLKQVYNQAHPRSEK